MKRVSNAYKVAMNKAMRNHSYMVVSLGVISNEAQTNATVTSESAYFSNNKIIFKSAKELKDYATFEDNVFRLDGSMLFPPDDSEYAQFVNNVGFVSKNIKGGITISFAKPYDIKGLTIDFGEYYPTEFTVSINGGAAETRYNSSNVYSDEQNYEDMQSLTITPIHFINGDNKRLRINNILMGVGLFFDNADIESASLSDSTSFISEELPQIDFNIVCFDRNKKFNVDDANSFVNYLEQGQIFTTQIGIELDDGTIEWVKLPQTYLSTWSSNSDKVAFSSVDRLSFMSAKYEGGNRISSRTLYDDAEAVLSDAGLEPDEYDIDEYLRTITVVNPLPIVSHAECLQLIANAGRCLLKQDVDGRIILVANFENILNPSEITIESDTQAEWSKPSNIVSSVDTVYADFSQDFFKLDGSMTFLPPYPSEYLNTGYVSRQISDGEGNFIDNLLPYPYEGNRTQGGITFTYNEDGSVHAEGTCTADTWYPLHNNGGSNPWKVADCPWALNDVLQCDYFLDGSINGVIGITWGYKTSSSSANQGYIFYRSEQYFEMTNTRVKFSDIKRQTVDPTERIGQYLTGYIYVRKGCVIDCTISPTLTKRNTLGNLIDGCNYRFMRSGTGNVWVHRGVTYTLNDDGSILVNGTATGGDSSCEIVNPYNASQRKALESGHNYILSEGTGRTEYHTDTLAQLVLWDTVDERWYYPSTYRGTLTYTANISERLSYGIRIVVNDGKTADNVLYKPSLIDVDDYDSTEKAPASYIAGTKPQLSITLPTTYTYYGFNMKFEGNYPTMLHADLYRNNTLLESFDSEITSNNFYVAHDMIDFSKLVLTFKKSSPHSRVVLNELAFGKLTDYQLYKSNMEQKPIGTVNPKTQSVSVKVCTFENDQNNTPKLVNDNVYYVYDVESIGENITFENQLISTQEHAEDVAKWIANYYANNITYEVSYRGEPRIESADYIILDSDIKDNLQVEVEALSLEFTGSIKGTLSLRRAANLIGD